MSALKELTRLVDRDGYITPESVLDEARPDGSPLHRYFEWDDDVAAEQYRLVQARQLIVRYSVEVEIQPEKVIRPRAFVNSSPGRYTPIADAMRDPDARDRVMQSAIRELSALRRKYEHLCDFDAAIQASSAARRRGKKAAAK